MPNLHKKTKNKKNNADFYHHGGSRHHNNNNINCQRTVKNRLSPAQSNTGKWVRLLNIIIQEQNRFFQVGGRAGSLNYLPARLSFYLWLQLDTAFVRLESPAAEEGGSGVEGGGRRGCFFVRGSGCNSLNSQSVHTQGGDARSEKKHWLSDLWKREEKKNNARWREGGGGVMGVMCDEVGGGGGCVTCGADPQIILFGVISALTLAVWTE